MSKKEIPWGYIDGKEIYLKSYLDLPDRKIGEVKDSDDASVQYFTDRYDHIKSKIDQLETDIESAENKGSYLMKLIHFREKLRSHDGLGDYITLLSRLDKQEEQLRDLIASNRVRNEEIKAALLTEFDQFKTVVDWKEATNLVLDIKERWLKTGAVNKDLNEEYDRKFNNLMQDFFDRKNEYISEKRRLTEIRIEKYRNLIDNLKKIDRQSGTNVKAEIDKLKDEWRKVGNIPPGPLKKLNKEFGMLSHRLYKHHEQPIKTISDEDLNSNLELKQELLEKAIELEKKDALIELQEVQKSWDQVGLIPKEHYKELTEQFKTVCEKAFEKRFLEQLAHNKDETYESKNNREKTRFRISLLKDLLKRDEKDLQSFLHNMDRFNRGQKFDKMMNNKLLNQKRKVTVKRLLLQELKNSLDSVKILK